MSTRTTSLSTLSTHHGDFIKYWIGVDNLIKSASTLDINEKYPPHNIIRKSDHEYEIMIAVAGFSKDEIFVTTQRNPKNPNLDELIIEGKKVKDDELNYIHKGIAFRNFRKTLHITNPLKIMGASITDGLLIIKIEAENAEDYKPKQILIE